MLEIFLSLIFERKLTFIVYYLLRKIFDVIWRVIASVICKIYIITRKKHIEYEFVKQE